jgi:hypothetical protein
MSFLRENLDNILQDITQNSDYLRKQNLLFRAFSGNLGPLFEERLSQMNSSSMINHMRNFKDLPNYFQKAVNKLSGIYSFDVTREWKDNQDIYDYYIENMNPDLVLHRGNSLSNAMQSVLLEIYFKKGELKLRSIPNDKFWVWTNDSLDPTDPLVYIKIVSDVNSPDKRTWNQGVNYYLYTEDEFLSVNNFISKGSKKMKTDIMKEGENPLGFVPFTYVNYDAYNLIPEYETAAESLAINPGFNLTSANVATHFQAYPIRTLKNVDKDRSQISINPDDVIILNSEEGSDKDPSLDELASSLDITKVLDLIKFQVTEYFFTKDCPIEDKASGNKSDMALVISNVDTLENRKKQIEIFKVAEQDLWYKVGLYHNWLIKNKLKDLDEDTPKGEINTKKSNRVNIEFELPSAEAEQVNEVNGDSEDPIPNNNQEE